MEPSLTEKHLFDYDEFQAVIDGVGLRLSAPELQGYQAGLLSLGMSLADFQWWEHLLTDYPHSDPDSISLEDRQALHALMLHTINGLESNQFEFDLLLPDDDASLILRVSSLADWCSGYLSGLQTALTCVSPLIRAKVEQSEQIKEVLVDLSAIRQADGLQISEVEDLLETERNYAEITEYVRVAVMNIYMEIVLEVLDDAEAKEGKPTVH